MPFTGMFQIAAVMTGFGGLGTDYKVSGGQSAPTKSAVVGMLAAADGRSKEDSIEDLNRLLIGTCTTNSGVMHSRFGTITGGRQLDGSMRRNPLIRKKAYFQAGHAGPADDFLIRHIVAFQSNDLELVRHLLKRLTAPVFPVFIGRSNCRPVEPLALGYTEGTLSEAFKLVKVPTTATLEVLPSTKVAHKRRLMDGMDGFSSRNVQSRFVVQQKV